MTGLPAAMTNYEDEQAAMSFGVEALFTSALGLKSPWEVVKVELDTAQLRPVSCDRLGQRGNGHGAAP